MDTSLMPLFVAHVSAHTVHLQPLLFTLRPEACVHYRKCEYQLSGRYPRTLQSWQSWIGGACAKYRKQLGTMVFRGKPHWVPRAGIKCHSETSERLILCLRRDLALVRIPGVEEASRDPSETRGSCRELLTLCPSKVSEQTCSRTCEGLTDAFGVRQPKMWECIWQAPPYPMESSTRNLNLKSQRVLEEVPRAAKLEVMRISRNLVHPSTQLLFRALRTGGDNKIALTAAS